jgi:hypothetical protein
MNLDGKYNIIFQDLKKNLLDSQKRSQKGLLVTLLHLVTKILSFDKRCFFSLESTWHRCVVWKIVGNTGCLIAEMNK